MLPYLIKSSLMLIVLYGCFVALLGKETFFRLNRIVLLSIIMSVLIIPALNITLPKPDFSDIWDEELSYTPITHEHINHIPLNIADEEASTEATQMPIIPNDEQIPIEYHEEPTPFPWQKIIIGIYLLGLAWRVGLFVWQILLFRREIKRGLHQKDQYGNKITILSGDFVPYSFFHHIVISVKDYEQMRTPILVHEQAHAKLGHSWDIMLLEILCAIQWFNPFCYMLARELRCVHEYEADNEVLNHGIDATQYQQLLVIKAVGKHLQSFANNFNRNSLKKRIIMMNKQKSNKRLMYRGLFLPLVLVIAVIAYAKPKIESHMGDNCIELFPIDTAQLNSAYRTLSINPDNKEAQEQFFNAFPKNWSEFIITYQYDDSEDYDLTMYFLADDHITTLGEKLTLIDKYTYYKRLISLGIGGSWDADAPNYLKSLLHSKMKENTTTMLECLSQLDREKQLQFWAFYWSYGHCRDTEITDPEYNLLLTENEAKFPIAMETMKQVYTADEESKKQVQNTINDIHSKAERMARSGQRNTSKLTEEYNDNKIPTNEIHYTTIENSVLPFNFGEGRIVSNSYVPDKNVCILEFDKDVTEIEKRAFSACSSLKSITIPQSVTKIGVGAFCGCSSLTSITIPQSVTKIGVDAFSACSSLTSITIPQSVTEIGKYAFGGCSSLTSISIPPLVTEIGKDAFYGCSGLTSIIVSKDNKFYDSREDCNAIIHTESNTLISGCKNTIIPPSVTEIGESAFSRCSSLTSITIPESVTEIGNDAFSRCSSLTSITIPQSVTEIGKDAFSHCSSLTSISIPESVTEIGNHAFYGCSSLTSITIPQSVTEIGEETFYRCSSLTSITIPPSVTKIGWYAFYGCSSLTEVRIPNGCNVDKSAFWDCPNVQIIRY